MKKLVVLFGVVMAFFVAAGAVRAQGGENPYQIVIEVNSAFVRTAPAPDAAVAASVFEEDVLDVVGRNLDGTWFEVRRPGRQYNLGWLFNEMGEWDFAPEYLPLTDRVTGVVGPRPLTEPPEFSIHVVEGVVLRTAPFFQGERITAVPPGSTVPLLARSPDASWLYVNYLGYEGWIIDFVTRPLPHIQDVPVAPGLPPVETFQGEIIPPEVQLAHVQRVREFVRVARAVATDLEGYWWLVNLGEVVPCQPPGFLAEYAYSPQDVRELPELERYVPRLNEGIQYLNSSIEPIYACGVLSAEVASQARADAINARIILDAALEQLDDLAQNVIR